MKKLLFLLFVTFYATSIIAQVQLYGLTSNGGTSGGESGIGTIFHYTPSTTAQTLDQSFIYTTPQTGAYYGSFTDGGNNKFYAMATYGGLYGKGTIFEWDPITNITVKKIDFDGINGANPQSTLTLRNGKLYGMTSAGGVNDMGVIFEWDPVTNIYTKKIDFIGTNGNMGSQPSGALVFKGGKFYGMTYSGGVNSRGVIFEWDPATNIYTKKIDFNGTNGANPFGALTLKGTKFYGMTFYGGANDEGAIFEWNPATNIYTKKIDLTSAGGRQPYGSMLLINSKFYGLTSNGGTYSYGVIFEWDPTTNIYTKKIDFNGSNGGGPSGSLVESGGKLYGTTAGGGAYSKGVIFEWNPVSNVYIQKINFGANNGDNPRGSLTLLSGKFYGMNTSGGGVEFNNGVIFEWDPTTNVYIKKLNFRTTNGGHPYGSLSVSGNKMYGMTISGGANDDGVIFEWDPTTNAYTIKFSFSYYTTGSSPQGGALTLYNGKFYGTAPYGGAAGGTYMGGVIFEWDPVTNIYTKKIDLNQSSGYNPTGTLTLYNGKFYGLTSFGAAPFARGVIFEWDPATNIYTKKNGFDGGANGDVPVGTLILKDNKFYAMTVGGGANNRGTIFEWDPATNTLTKKIDMNDATGTPGNFSTNSLILSGSKFYGTTLGGGANGAGVIFEWDPVTNIYTKKMDFISTNGGSPYGSLILSGDKFYGTTKAGGLYGMGVVFKWDAATNTYTKLVDFNDANGNAPYGDLVVYNSGASPTISISNKSVTEGNSGTTAMKFKVTLSAASLSQVEVNYATADSIATATSDYVATSGTLKFNAGQTSKNITVLINGDTQPEKNEKLKLILSAPVNATIADGLGIGTIRNDDAAPFMIDGTAKKTQEIIVNNTSIKVSPNPAKNQITISGLSAGTANYIELTDLNGRSLLKQKVSNTYQTLDISKYANGTYLLVYFDGNKIQQVKFIKE